MPLEQGMRKDVALKTLQNVEKESKIKEETEQDIWMEMILQQRKIL